MARKRKFMVVPRNKRAAEQGLATDQGKLSFRGKTALYVNDPALAKNIDAEHGLKGNGDVYVYEDDRLERHARNDNGQTHNYFFGTNRRYAQGWERIFGEQHAKESQDV